MTVKPCESPFENFLYCDEIGDCCVCGRPTHYVEVNFESRLHLFCEVELVQGYRTALAATDTSPSAADAPQDTIGPDSDV